MFISHKHKFIFIHNPRTAGNSIQSLLQKYTLPPGEALDLYLLRKLHMLPPYKRYHTHVRAWQLKEKFPSHIYNNYFKFTFVRNPWDRMVSIYNHIVQTPAHEMHQQVVELKGFEAYLKWGKNKFHQIDFVTDVNKDLIVDFVGSYENLEEDFNKVKQILGITGDLPTLHASDHKPYMNYYETATRDFVRSTYADDIKLFKYEYT